MTQFDEKYYQGVINGYEVDYVGLRVIFVSNEPEPVVHGILIGWTQVCQSKQEMPVVRLDNGETKIVLGFIVPFSDEIWDIVKDMHSKTAWFMFAGIRQLWNKCKKKDSL